MSKYQICVSGAHSGETVELAGHLAYKIGAEIAKSGHTLTTGLLLACLEWRGWVVM